MLTYTPHAKGVRLLGINSHVDVSYYSTIVRLVTHAFARLFRTNAEPITDKGRLGKPCLVLGYDKRGKDAAGSRLSRDHCGSRFEVAYLSRTL